MPFFLPAKASESLKETVKDRRDEHQDDLKGCREEHNRRYGESDKLTNEKSRQVEEDRKMKQRSRTTQGKKCFCFWFFFRCSLEKNHFLFCFSPTDENQPSKCSRDILNNPILIAVALVTCIMIGVVIVVLVV